MRDWGFERMLPYGKALSVLFSGPPGTGKTMAASIVARELDLPMYRVNLASIVSKYIGETEKNLEQVFSEAQLAHVVLVFDEADSLFSRRTQVRDSVDRYANLEVNFLLQKMEAFDGVVVLPTNFESSLDEAFKRRIRYKVHFPFPEASVRSELWAAMIPGEADVDEDLDFGTLGEDFELSGGHIKNAVVRAACA